jgi:hypothetical protein
VTPNSKTEYNALTISKIREAAADSLLMGIDALLFHINTSESGYLVETILQLLPNNTFDLLANLVVQHETDDLVRGFCTMVAVHVAQKTGQDITEYDAIMNGASSVLALIQFENLRRKGQIEYSSMNDIFIENPKDQGFTRLTELGKQLTAAYILETFNGKSIQ